MKLGGRQAGAGCWSTVPRVGLCPESSGAVGGIWQGVTEPDLCFEMITLAAAWTLDGGVVLLRPLMQAWSDVGLKGGRGD